MSDEAARRLPASRWRGAGAVSVLDAAVRTVLVGAGGRARNQAGGRESGG